MVLIFIPVLLFTLYTVYKVEASPLVGSHHDWVDEEDNSPQHIISKNIRDMKRYVDTTVDPCDDFYQYACGNWQRTHSIPSDDVEQSTMHLLNAELELNLKQLLEDQHDMDTLPNSAISKAKLFYASCMNERSLKRYGIEPLVSSLESIGKWPLLNSDWDEANFDWINYTAQMHLIAVETFFGVVISEDLHDPEQNIVYIGQPEIVTNGLRSISFAAEKQPDRFHQFYKQYIAGSLEVIGVQSDIADEAATNILNLHMEIQKIKTNKIELTINWHNVYQRMHIDGFQKSVPKIDFQKYFEIIIEKPLNTTRYIGVVPLSYIRSLSTLLEQTNKTTIANYIFSKYLEHFAGDTDERFARLEQEFKQGLIGIETKPPRWKYCLEKVIDYFNDALSAMYIRKYFDEESRQDITRITVEVQHIFKQTIQNSDWLDDNTKQSILKKINKMELQLGYPEYMLTDRKIDNDLRGVHFLTDQHFENIIRISKYSVKEAIKRLNETVDKSRFGMSPISVNAGYHVSKNRIIVTAAILQPPIYSRHFPRSIKFGGVGSFIAHEIMHAFDSTGQAFHHDGTMRDLWTPATTEEYNDISICFKEKYSRYKIGELHLSGDDTASENIADNIGLQISYEAYNRWLSLTTNNNSEVLDYANWTSKQLFFLSYAQLWCHKSRPEVVSLRLKTDTHSPAKYRVVGTLSNFKEFAVEYDCRLGTEMNPINKCKIW